jgi:hypothetical protein
MNNDPEAQTSLQQSPGQRPRWNLSNRWISYHERATTLGIQHPRSPTLASRRHNGVVIADAARDRPSRLISCGEAERHRRVQGAKRIARCIRGLRELSGWNLEQTRKSRKGRRRDKWRGGRAGIYGRRERQRGSALRAFPN